MRRIFIIMLVLLASCGSEQVSGEEKLPPGKQRLKVDDVMIDKGNLEGIVLPMTWWIAVHGTDQDYLYEMRRFSKGQRLLYAVVTYLDDTKKEGHLAYFRLAAPLAVADAMEGLHLMGLEEHAKILAKAIEKKSSTDLSDLDLDDEDVALLELNESLDSRGRIIRYIQANKHEFYYNEIVQKPGS